jgi:X-Pro dipeptidyl-peptidase
VREGALLLVAAGLLLVGAGCLGDEAPVDQARNGEEVASNATEPVYEDRTRSEHVIQGEVQGHETEEIWLDVYRPAEADHEVPVILVMTPYQSLGDAGSAAASAEEGQPASAPPEQAPYDGGLVDFFVPRGYAVAFADVRGNHNAGGCIAQSGEDQWWDGYYTVEWLADRNWSNGQVGMYGVSYDGETQLTTALLSPPSLATIVPIASVDSQYGYLYYEGVPYELQGASTMAAYLAISAVPGTHPNAAETYPERFTCQPRNLQHALDLSGDWNDYWDERAYWQRAPDSNVSMLRVHGFQDWNVKPDHLDPSSPRWGGEPQREIYGQWSHATPDRDDWDEQGGILHQWYDRFLYGMDNRIVDELPPVLAEDTAERWHGVDRFHETGIERVYRLSADGRLVTGEAQAGEATIHDHPRGTQGVGGEAVTDEAVQAAANASGTPTRLVFETSELDEELVVAGRPQLTLEAATEAESTHWVMHLERVDENGTSEWINRGYQDTRHRDGLEDPQPLEPGEPYNLSIEGYPQLDVLEPGDKLRLVLTNQDDWVHQDTTYAESTVWLGPEAELRLPLLPADATRIGADTLEPASP